MTHRTPYAIDMAFRSPTRPPPSDPVPRIDDLPAYSRYLLIRRALGDARDDRQRRLDIIALRGELRASTPAERSPRSAVMADRLARLEAQTPPPKAPAPDPSGLPPVIAQAMRLAAGETVEPEPDHDTLLKRLRRDVASLEKALTQVEQKLEAIREDASLVIAEQLRPQHDEILRSILAGAVALAAAIDAERELFAQPILMGYTPRPDVLHRPALDGAARLGSANEYDSQAFVFPPSS